MNRFLKIDKWWIYKIGSGVFTLILFKVLISDITFNVFDVLLFSILLLLAVLGHFINDFSDYAIDKIAKKGNIFDTIPFRFAPFIIVALSLGVSLLTAVYFSKIALLFVILQITSSIVYSLKPFRIKEKGFFALILTGFYERMNPYLIILFSLESKLLDTNTGLIFLTLYLIWSYLWECRNFINGQMKDEKNDKQSKVKSVVIIFGRKRIARLKNILLVSEIFMLSSWMLIFIMFNIHYLYFLIFVLLFQLIQAYSTGSRYTKLEVVLDNCYSNIFLASLLIVLLVLNSINPIVAIVAILLFQFRLVVDTLDFTYYRIKHSLYYSWKFIIGQANKSDQEKDDK